jgi:hypothetical protein
MSIMSLSPLLQRLRTKPSSSRGAIGWILVAILAVIVLAVIGLFDLVF